MAELVGYKGEELDLLVKQGSTYGPIEVELQNPDASLVVLDDINFRGQIRKTFDSPDVVGVFTFRKFINAAGSLVAEFVIEANVTAQIPAGPDENHPDSIYEYDIEYFNDANRVLPLLYGKVKMFREVTK